MGKIHAVQQMQDYIETHINEKITMHALTACTAYSPWHASRIFKDLLEKTPFDYIRELRLAKAAKKLQSEDVRVLDIALDYVFDTHEGFTRAFHKTFGITPKNYQKLTPPLYFFQPSPIRDYYRKFQGGDPITKKGVVDTSFFVQVIRFPERKLIYKAGINATDYFSYCEEVDCDIWGLLCSIKEALYEPVGIWFPPFLQPQQCSSYVQGVEVPIDYQGIIPEGLSILTLPACEMMLFQGASYNDELYGEAIDYLADIIDQYEPSLYGYHWDDHCAPRIQLEPQGYRGYIEGRSVIAHEEFANHVQEDAFDLDHVKQFTKKKD